MAALLRELQKLRANVPASSATAAEYCSKVNTALSTARQMVGDLHGAPAKPEELPAFRGLVRHYFELLLAEKPLTNPLTPPKETNQ